MILAEDEGFEPPTRISPNNGFQDRRNRPLCQSSNMCLGMKSNHRRGDLQSPALPLSYQGICYIVWTEFKPAKSDINTGTYVHFRHQTI